MAKYVKDKYGNIYTPEEYQKKQADLLKQHESKTVSDKSGNRYTPSEYQEKQAAMARHSEKSTKNTIEAKEKAKTRSTIEAAFVGNRSSAPSKEEQERMRRQGARNAANMYSKNYSGRRG